IPASGAIVWPMADGGFVAPLWSRLRGSGLDTGETCCFIQKRIAFFGGLVALLAAGFFIIGFGIDVLVFHVEPVYILSMPWTIAHGTGTFLIASLWAIARHGCVKNRNLEILDAVFLIATCSAWAAMVVPGQIDSVLAP